MGNVKGRMGEGKVREFGMDMYTGCTYCIAHGTLLNVMWQPGWEQSLGENGYICLPESLPCSLETITTLLIIYTPIQNEK